MMITSWPTDGRMALIIYTQGENENQKNSLFKNFVLNKHNDHWDLMGNQNPFNADVTPIFDQNSVPTFSKFDTDFVKV